MEACRGCEGVLNCVVLYPKGRVSPIQERQMQLASEELSNVHLIACEGSSDDLDQPCEGVLRDADFRHTHRLGTVNSVNIVRMLVQTCHFFYTYLTQSQGADRPPVNVSIPSGAAGHLTACILAKLMGLPINGIMVATNQVCRIVTPREKHTLIGSARMMCFIE